MRIPKQISNRNIRGGGYPYVAPQDIHNLDFDYVVIACEGWGTYIDIRESLIALKIPLEKIVWYYCFTFFGRHVQYCLSDVFCKSCLDYDGIILGNSYALRGIDTSYLQKCFCNLGWHGMDMYYCYSLLRFLAEKCNEKMRKIKHVILCFPYYFFNYDMSCSLWQLQTGQYWALDNLGDPHHFPQMKEWEEYKRLYEVNRKLFGKRQGKRSLTTWMGDNREHFSAQNWKADPVSHVWGKLHEETIQENRMVFHNLLELLQERNLKPLLLVMPYHKVMHDNYKDDFAEKRELFYKCIEDESTCPQLPVIDWFEHEVSYDESFWADETHLNVFGSEKITKELNKYIIEHEY